MAEIFVPVSKENQTSIMSFNTNDRLDDIYKSIEQQFGIDMTKYMIMYKSDKHNQKQILNEDVSLPLLFNCHGLQFFLKELKSNEDLMCTGTGPIQTIDCTVTVSLPVEQQITALKDANLDGKSKKWWGLKQHVDAKMILTKFFLSEISSNNGTNYLEKHLIKNDNPTPLNQFIRKNLNNLLASKQNITEYIFDEHENSLNDNNESFDLIIKMKSKVVDIKLIVVVGYAIVNNEQKNLAGSLVKKLVSDRKLNKDIQLWLDEWVNEKINSF